MRTYRVARIEAEVTVEAWAEPEPITAGDAERFPLRRTVKLSLRSTFDDDNELDSELAELVDTIREAARGR